eukprot:6412473-Prorocentrum_lima.AAC.1
MLAPCLANPAAEFVPDDGLHAQHGGCGGFAAHVSARHDGEAPGRDLSEVDCSARGRTVPCLGKA